MQTPFPTCVYWCLEIVSLKQFTEFSMKFEKLDIVETDFCNLYGPFFHQEQYCP